MTTKEQVKMIMAEILADVKKDECDVALRKVDKLNKILVAGLNAYNRRH